MPRTRAVSVCLFVWLVCIPGLAATSAAQSDGSPEIASVSGVVMDASGATVAGAQISLLQSDCPKQQQLETLTSDPHGAFTFADVPAGSYCLRVDATGFATFLSKQFALGNPIKLEEGVQLIDGDFAADFPIGIADCPC